MLTKIYNIKSLVTYDDDRNDVVIQTPKNIIIKDIIKILILRLS